MSPIGFDQLGLLSAPLKDVFAAVGELAPRGKIEKGGN
jgi:hypothetical protein